jgi:AcrR family transcriptional regulator
VAGRETQERLIDTAERLFAEHGFDGVTFKQITEEAGQRNASALQYHFGTKQELVQAIALHRIPTLSDRREAMLDELEATGRDKDLRAVVCALVYPLAEQLDDGTAAGGRYYIRFLSQVLSNPRSRLHPFGSPELNKGIVRAGAMAALLMGHLPAEVVHQRLAVLAGFVVGALADYERGSLDDRTVRPPAEFFVSNLIDVVVGMLSQPVSAETREALERSEAADSVATSDASRTSPAGS